MRRLFENPQRLCLAKLCSAANRIEGACMELAVIGTKVVEKIVSAEFLLDAALLTSVLAFVSKLSWAFASSLVRRAHAWSLRKPQRHRIVVAKTTVPFEKDVAKVFCLIVRYGSDQYIEHMASDREKHDGRLLNEVLKVQVLRALDGSVSFVANLPIHKRLGTQFKCFVDVAPGGPKDAVLEFLSSHEEVTEVSESSSFKGGDRIYFLLKKFAMVTTVEGFKNNMCFPH
jgi:hypothetical protein